ncbi:MAG: bifunctional DNA-formamidopyrimidine glycosylase/DNA-(apurinic or apyrimidinic site) lyase [Alphaproteobacteria bacterium]|nr:bifunctional DNA-formamidopyrimidine glycosylase/DNA-(apurinic or apyrimidinic site) lyase [Alphaproteobacteria bacterium]
MPELPEVETVCRGLRSSLDGRTITRVDQRRPDLRFPLPRGFGRRLEGRRVCAIDRRGKYVLVRFDADMVLLIHLGMSGRLIIHRGQPNQLEKHDHVIFTADDGTTIVFNDPRRFGSMDIVATSAMARHKLLRSMGPEPLDKAFQSSVLEASLRGKRTPIKAALLDQHVVAGLGNIYVCEALFRAGVSPRRLARSVRPDRIKLLVSAIKSVLTEAIAAGGSSLKDYVQTNGELGYFQHRFAVYDREGQPCPGCTCNGAIKRIVQNGRSTFYCSMRQR